MVRKSELQDAIWDEVDFENAVWTIPQERMKRSKAHNSASGTISRSWCRRIVRLIDAFKLVAISISLGVSSGACNRESICPLGNRVNAQEQSGHAPDLDGSNPRGSSLPPTELTTRVHMKLA
jgi:hypothetical protein